jgi:hypothetical protein
MCSCFSLHSLLGYHILAVAPWEVLPIVSIPFIFPFTGFLLSPYELDEFAKMKGRRLPPNTVRTKMESKTVAPINVRTHMKGETPCPINLSANMESETIPPIGICAAIHTQLSLSKPTKLLTVVLCSLTHSFKPLWNSLIEMCILIQWSTD